MLSDPDRLAELGRLGARLVLQRAVEDEVAAFLGRAPTSGMPFLNCLDRDPSDLRSEMFTPNSCRGANPALGSWSRVSEIRASDPPFGQQPGDPLTIRRAPYVGLTLPKPPLKLCAEATYRAGGFSAKLDTCWAIRAWSLISEHSARQPETWKADALPTELLPRRPGRALS